MGYRLHVCKKYVVEYGTGAFNWGHTEINGLLNATCDGTFSGEDPYYSEEIEIKREEFKKLTYEILKGTDEQIKKRLIEEYEMNEGDIKALQEIGFDRIRDDFRMMYKESKKTGEYVRFCWF